MKNRFSNPVTIAHLLAEGLLIFALILLFNNFLGNPKETIKSDGFGYYDYLVSIFITHDIDRKDETKTSAPEFYQRAEDLSKGKVAFGIYLDYGDKLVNKYSCGTALLLSPFFITTKALTEGDELTGYEPPFQKMVMIAALFYLLLTLVFFRQLLRSYQIPWLWIIFCQILLVFATAVPHYTYFDASWSHIYSLCAITAFLMAVKRYFEAGEGRWLAWAIALLGLIFILRQVNVIIVLLTPFLAGDWKVFKTKTIAAFSMPKHLILGLLGMALFTGIQSALWYFQTGDFILYSYQEEGFDFMHPRILDQLFSYQKGLFVYYPILLICVAATLCFAWLKRWFELASFLGFFGILVYIFSSWWCWDYGACFGQRPYIDFYTAFFIPMAVALQKVNKKTALTIGLVSALTIPFTAIQIYQYQHFILHWYNMNKERYWDVFLQTDLRYRYFVWKNELDWEQHIPFKTIDLGKLQVSPFSEQVIFNHSLGELNLEMMPGTIHVTFRSDFSHEETGVIHLSIYREDQPEIFVHAIPVFHFGQRNADGVHLGNHQFSLPFLAWDKDLRLRIRLDNASDRLEIDDLTLRFYGPF